MATTNTNALDVERQESLIISQDEYQRLLSKEADRGTKVATVGQVRCSLFPNVGSKQLKWWFKLLRGRKMMNEAFKRKVHLGGHVKVTVSTSGGVEVDRQSLYASRAYQEQVEALKRIVAEGIGKAPSPQMNCSTDKG